MKDEIRKEMKTRRRARTPEEIERTAEKVTAEILKTDAYLRANTVCLYMSAYKEVDTSKLLASCKADGKTVALPVTDEDGVITLYEDSGEYEVGNFGLKIPVGSKPISPQDVDLFILPALAYDKQGNRLGFGKGCYDRLLENTSGYKIGIGYAFQLLECLPSDVHDIKMDIVICK